MKNDFDLQAPWVGKCKEDYYGEDDEEECFDADLAYESWRDLQMDF